MREVVVLEHTPGAGAAAFVPVLESHAPQLPWRTIEVPSGQPLPEPDELAGLIVMGGTMSAVHPDDHAWMPAELALLQTTVEAQLPVLGVCLGAQLLGQALGGTVVRRPVPRVAYTPLHRTPAGRDDEVVGGYTDGTSALFVHEDEVAVPPPGAEALFADDEGTPGWRLGSALAVQFHPEVTLEQLAGWTDTGALDDLLAAAGVEAEALLSAGREHAPSAVAEGTALVDRFLAGPVSRAQR